MKKAAAKSTTTKVGSGRQSTFGSLVIAAQLLDITWRVALPIILFSLVGHWLDQHFDSKPAYLMTGFFLSLPVIVWLVYRQLRSVYPEMFVNDKGKMQ